ncbi:MAG: hypothetical protein R3B53_02375 [Candidatus Paceibacterota bacterium]
MSWLLLATLGQFLGAVVVFLDKYIVTDEKALPRPFVYAFYSCLLTGFWVLVYFLAYVPGLTGLGIPSFSEVQKPTIQVIGMSFLAAYTFFMALVSLYDALRRSEAVNVMPVVGVISTVSTFTLSYFLLDVILKPNFIWGVLILVLGTLLVAQTLPERYTMLTVLQWFFLWLTLYFDEEALFLETSFADGFFLVRIGLMFFCPVTANGADLF